jgi:type II secretory ATPase GspE/PulE/Tfp pilus assembly ATPase PilB-like protein
MSKNTLLKKWGWPDNEEPPFWIEKQALEYTQIDVEGFRLGEILIHRGHATKPEVDKWLLEKEQNISSQENTLGEFINNARGTKQTLRDALLPAVVACSQYQLPFFYSVSDVDGFSLHPDLYSNEKLQVECVALNGVLLECEQTTNAFMIFSDVFSYENFKQRSTHERLDSEIQKYFDEKIFFGFAHVEVILDALKHVKSGEQSNKAVEFVLKETSLCNSGVDCQNILSKMLNYIVSNNGSDLHITPKLNSDEVIVQGRFNTKLKRLPLNLQINKELYLELSLYLSITSQATDHGAPVTVPCDGNALDYHRKSGDVKVRLRPDFMPMGFDKMIRIVLRISPLDGDVKKLQNLNLSQSAITQLNKVVERKGKLSIMVGPMGSGKTTTMYAVLQGIIDNSDGGQCLASLEDPIEQIIPGIAQVQISRQSKSAGLGYSHYLKHFKRQDTNVLYVGEIRDHDTAENAVQFGAIGNKVITTLHAHDELEGVQRLLTMLRRKDEQYLMISNLGYILSQRIIPILCKHCKIKVKISDEEKNNMKSLLKDKAPFEHETISSQIPDMQYIEGTVDCLECGNVRISTVQPVLGVIEVTEDVKDLMLSDNPQKKRLIANTRPLTMLTQVIEMIRDGRCSLGSLDL